MKHVYVTLTPVEADKLSSIKLSGRCKDFTGVRVNKVKVVRPIHRKGRAILNTQGSRCLGCGTYQPDGVGWVVDHNHETGDVRGVLCSTCNLILGLVKDSPERLEMLALYLKQQRTVSVETVTI